MQKASLPKGTRDFSPQAMRIRKHIMGTIEKVYLKYGFEPIETPAMENLSTLTGKYGDEGDQLLFKILNSGDYLSKVTDLSSQNAQSLLPKISEKGLRYDLTVPFARFVVQNQTEITFPFKRYQIQPVWRADRPQKGRYREFWQCDADVIGTDSLVCEADFIQIYHEVFHLLGLGHYELYINHRSALEAITAHHDIQDFKAFTVAIDKLDKKGWDGIADELLGLGIQAETQQILKSQLQNLPLNRNNAAQLFRDLKPSESLIKAKEDFNRLFDILENLDIEANIRLDLTLARGLDYYTGFIFEAKMPGSGIGSVSGGGRYDNLTGIFGLKGVSGVGISFGIDRLQDVLEQGSKDKMPYRDGILLLHFDSETEKYALAQAKKMRAAGIPAYTYLGNKKMKKQMDYANKTNMRFVAIAGQQEVEKGVLTFKNLDSGEQHEKSADEIIKEWGS
jgi:histidyl-tRNA synthetase